MTAPPTICLTSPTGQLGRAILTHLLSTLNFPSTSLILSSSHPNSPSLTPYRDLGIPIRHGDLLAPSTLSTAFAGAHTLLIVSYPSIAHRIRITAHGNAILAARAAGVRRVIYTSLCFNPSGPGGRSAATVMRAHHDTELILTQTCGQSGGEMSYTIIREAIYAEGWPLYLGFASVKSPPGLGRTVVIPSSGGAGVAWVSCGELAEGTARILVGDEARFENTAVLLTGPRAYTLAETAGAVSRYLGWKDDEAFEVEIVAKDGFVEYQLNNGKGRGQDDRERKEFLEHWATTYKALDNGDCAIVDPMLEDLLGRKPRTFEECLNEVLPK